MSVLFDDMKSGKVYSIIRQKLSENGGIVWYLEKCVLLSGSNSLKAFDMNSKNVLTLV